MISHDQFGFELRGHCFWIFLNFADARARLIYWWFMTCKCFVSESWRCGSERDLKTNKADLWFSTWRKSEARKRCALSTVSWFSTISWRVNLKELIVHASGIIWPFANLVPDPTNAVISCPIWQKLSRATQVNQNEISCFEITLAQWSEIHPLTQGKFP